MKRTIRVTLGAILATMFVLGMVPSLNAQCSNASFGGSFGFTFTGTAPEGNIAAVGSLTADGAGNVVGSQTISINGTIFQGDGFAGTYTVNPGCTGNATLTFSPRGVVARFDLVIDGSGLDEVRFIQTDTAHVITGTARQFPLPLVSRFPYQGKRKRGRLG